MTTASGQLTGHVIPLMSSVTVRTSSGFVGAVGAGLTGGAATVFVGFAGGAPQPEMSIVMLAASMVSMSHGFVFIIFSIPKTADLGQNQDHNEIARLCHPVAHI